MSVFGSTRWIEEFFPEYVGITAGVKVKQGRVSRTKSLGIDVVRQINPWTALGFKELWDSSPEDHQALADSINFYRNGGHDPYGYRTLDPALYKGFEYLGRSDDRALFQNEHGKLLAGLHPMDTPGREYGVNATFNLTGKGVYRPHYYHHILKDFSPGGEYSDGTGKFVPGFNYTALALGLPSYRGLYTGDHPNWEYLPYPIGTNIYGVWGFLGDEDVDDRKEAAQTDHPIAVVTSFEPSSEEVDTNYVSPAPVYKPAPAPIEPDPVTEPVPVPDPVVVPEVPKAPSKPVEVEEEPGLFTRFLNWLKGLFQ